MPIFTHDIDIIVQSSMGGSGNVTLACPKITQNLKSQAAQGFSGCLEIDNAMMKLTIIFFSVHPLE